MVPLELLDLVARWIHVIAGIMWAGNSLLFNWIDRSLERPDRDGITPQPVGTLWLLHSGGFYYVEKTLLAGMHGPTPRILHWFKWQAYTTWLSGFALLVVVYWAGARSLLGDPSVAVLSPGMDVVIAVGSVFGGWAVYELAQRAVAPRAPALALALWLTALLAITIGITMSLSGRAAYLHVGAMLGTIMAGNVFVTIVPSQRALVASISEGPASAVTAATLSARAKRVSIHNNYFTFPVIVLMVSSHFPGLYGHPMRAALLLTLVAGGATIRHVLNIRFTFPAWRGALGGAIASTIVLLAVLMRIGARDSLPVGRSSTPVTFADVRHVVDRRCASCHASEPSDMSSGPAPGGVKFDTPGDIVRHAARIRERAVVTRTMPPNNKSRITDDERAVLARWNGALVP